jgi:hypothetical protein
MTTDTQPTPGRGPSPTLAATRFAVAGLLGCVALAATLIRGGLLALVGPPFVFFAGAFWAAGELRLGLRGRFGYGAAVAMGVFGSLRVLVATQAMTGRENIFGVLTVPLLVVNAVAGSLGLLVMLPGRVNAFAYGVLGFAVGAAASGVIAAALMESHQLNFYTALPLIPIPGVLSAAATACALRPMGSPRSREQAR